MKRYWLIAYDYHGACGGFEDIVLDTDDKEQAVTEAGEFYKQYDRTYLWDSVNHEYVEFVKYVPPPETPEERAYREKTNKEWITTRGGTSVVYNIKEAKIEHRSPI
jgi:hypothetical protein